MLGDLRYSIEPSRFLQKHRIFPYIKSTTSQLGRLRESVSRYISRRSGIFYAIVFVAPAFPMVLFSAICTLAHMISSRHFYILTTSGAFAYLRLLGVGGLFVDMLSYRPSNLGYKPSPWADFLFLNRRLGRGPPCLHTRPFFIHRFPRSEAIGGHPPVATLS